MGSVSLPPVLSSIVGWLRAGYPTGVPESDYVPLLAVLARRLSTEDVKVVTQELSQAGQLPIDDTDIGVMITRLTNEMPGESDVARVRTKLAAAGWPLA
ncbi:MAG: DUF3349 domain-containing protein [Propionibacteriaceae bacterium]